MNYNENLIEKAKLTNRTLVSYFLQDCKFFGGNFLIKENVSESIYRVSTKTHNFTTYHDGGLT